MVSLKDEMKGGTPPTPRRPGTPSQFDVAKQMLAFGEVSRPQPTAAPRVPEGKLPGMGGRKTKKGKKARRTTRRRHRGGGELDPKHVGVRMAKGLVGPDLTPPNLTPPLLKLFERLKTELDLTGDQVVEMIQAYSEARRDGEHPTEAEFRRYLIDRFKLNTRS